MGGVVEQITAPVKQAVSTVSNTVNNTLDQASRGDIGAAVSNQVGNLTQIAKAPLEIASDVARGDIKHAANTLTRTGGAALDTTGWAYLARTDAGKQVLTNPYVDKLTFGYSGDAYGTARGVGSLRNTGNISGEDLNSAVRFGVKTGAAAFVAATPALATHASWSNYGISQGIDSSLRRGDYLGAATQFAGAGFLPEIERPDWLPNIDLPKFEMPSLGSTSGSKSPTETSPWQWGGTADSGVSAAQVAGPSLMIIGAIFVGAYLLRKKGVI